MAEQDQTPGESGNGAEQFDAFSVPLSDLRERILSAEPTVQPEPVVEEPEGAPAATEDEPETGDTAPAAPEPEPEVTDMDILKAQMDLLASEVKTSEAIAGKATGELGYLRKQNQELLQRLQRQARGEDGEIPEPTEDADTEYQQPSPKRKTTDPALTWAVGQAVNAAGQQFISQYPEVFQHNKDGTLVIDPATGRAAFEPEFAKAISAHQSDTQRILTSDDPAYAAEETTRSLELAYVRADRAKKKARLEALAARKGVDTATLIAKKKVSASASASPGEPARPRPLDPRKMPLDQLKKRLLEGRYT